ncbi:MAG: hypothetical protein Q9227_003807 [Pyrenula ochraceoflavens]
MDTSRDLARVARPVPSSHVEVHITWHSGQHNWLSHELAEELGIPPPPRSADLTLNLPDRVFTSAGTVYDVLWWPPGLPASAPPLSTTFEIIREDGGPALVAGREASPGMRELYRRAGKKRYRALWAVKKLFRSG